MYFLRQSTASQEVLLDTFVDATDGVTAETALTIANTDIKISKPGATTLANKNSGGATHISAGNYYTVLDATDTDTVGSCRIVVQMAGALVSGARFTVLPAAIYDWLFGVIANLPVNVAQWLGTAPATPTTAGVPEVDMTHHGGTAYTAGALPAAAAGANGGLPTVDASNSVKIQARIKRAQALANFRFVMTDSTTDNPATGKTVTVTRGLDGSAQSAGTLSAVSEIGNGEYRVDFAAADMTANVVAFRATATGCNDLLIELFPVP